MSPPSVPSIAITALVAFSCPVAAFRSLWVYLSHRAYADRQAVELMDGASVEYVQWRMSGTHPKVDICDMFAKVDKYGLGPGIYPKEKAPAHPFCRCIIVPKRALNGRKAKNNPAAEREWLQKQGLNDAAQVMGSKARRDQVLKQGGDALTVWNGTHKDSVYHVRPLGDVEGTDWPLAMRPDRQTVRSAAKMHGMKSEELSLIARDLKEQSLSPVGALARDYVVSNGVRTGHEYGAVVRGSEVIARFTSNKENGLLVPRYLFARDGSVEIHHNHPSGDSLSTKDFAVLLSRNEVGAVVVHGHGGFYARADRVDLPMSDAKDAWLAAKSISSLATSLTRSALMDGVLTQRQAQSGLWQVVMGLLLSDDGRIDYNINSQTVRDLARAVINHGR
jgi:hypothetical protein